MKDMIISEKTREEEMTTKSIADMTTQAEVARILNHVDLAGKYNWTMSDAVLIVAKELRTTSLKKY